MRLLSSRLRNIDWRIQATIPLLLLTAAIIFLENSQSISGPWEGIYSQYAPFWLILGLSASLAVQWRENLPNQIIILYSFLLVISLVSISLIWKGPYGFSDPWRHLWIVRSQNISLQDPIYPLLHVLITEISIIIERRSASILSVIPLLASFLGVLFSLSVCSQLELNHRNYGVVILLIPGLLFGFVARPFTLAIPSILLAYWYVLARDDDSRAYIVGLTVFPAFVFLHPFVALIYTLILAVDSLVGIHHKMKSLPNLASRFVSSEGQVNHSLLLVIIVIILTFHLISSNIGGNIMRSLVLSLVGVETTNPAYQAGVASSATSSLRAIVEALIRGSYSLLFSMIAGIGILSGFLSKELNYSTFIAALSGIGTVGLFIVLAIFSPGGVGLFRILTLAPVISLPAVVHGFKFLDRACQNNTIIITVISILIISSGLGTAFVTPTTGGVEFTANTQQVAAADWIVKSNSDSVVASPSIFPIILGNYGSTTQSEVSVTDYPIASTRYSWMRSDLEYGTVYVVTEPAVTLARVDASEGATSPLLCLTKFRTRQGQIYDSEGIDVYLKSAPPSEPCHI